jgi:hypothetical protein
VELSDKDLSAHQFSRRELSCQADSEEREEINMQLQLIDEKAKLQSDFEDKVHIYDLNPKS